MRLLFTGCLVAVIPLLMAGCSKTTGQTPAATTAAAPKGSDLNCELKNGPTGCVDDAALAAEAKRKRAAAAQNRQQVAATTSRPSGREEFSPHMCKSLAEGGTGFFAFYGKLATGRLGELMAYCREIEGDTPARTASSPEIAGASNADKRGTWQCQLADGNGPILGVYEMINSPRVIASTCKKVGNSGVGNW
jgi:hypothetical protein